MTSSIHTGDDIASVIFKLNTNKIRYTRTDFIDKKVPHRATFALYAQIEDAFNPRFIAIGFDKDEKVVVDGVCSMSAWYTKPSPELFLLQR